MSANSSTQVIKEAIYAINGHREWNSANAVATVSARVRRQNIIQSEQIKVQFDFDGTNYAKISIFWEDYGFANYRELGLYGVTKSQFAEVEKSGERSMTITDSSYMVEIQY